MAKIEITLKKGLIGKSDRQRRNAAALGLFKKNQTVTHENTPDILGKVEKLHHVVDVHVVDGREVK